MPQYRFSPVRAAPLILLATLLSRVSADYVLVDDYEPSNFFDKFDFFTANDPTQGYVDYVNQTSAQEDGLIGNTSDRVYIGVDTKNTYNVYSDRGRPSVRLQSTQSYTHGLFILDLNHMPYGCGTWPAWWTVGDINTWPADGEIDIIEGVNANQNNTNKIYTANKGCSITGRGQSAIADAFDCSQGCGSQSTNPYSYGAGFGMISGGVYAMEWTSDYIRVWFFDRSNIPRSISAGQPDSSDFGMPMSNFQGACDIDRYFRNHKIVFDITFCGTWAGQAFNASPSCPLTPGHDAWDSCKFYVAGNPSAFQNAYWDINWMRVYQNTGGSSSAAASSSYPSTPISVAGSSFFGSSSGDLALGQSSPTTSALFFQTSASFFASSLAATSSSFVVVHSSFAVPSSFSVVQTPGKPYNSFTAVALFSDTLQAR
ncbi:concanavalin A-like lectin/glucanase domain-containing protein [Phyllosticta citribraziliensis]|uniref:Concanavalin A-like lectin/glucanase domain-containing protein n=1 Tax=Phyllosticta citribraziliensis TaxID=989973 RepID=A0ABR1M5E0_9PEZI